MNTDTLKIYNEFGIKPTNNYTSAGMDFYIPDLTNIQDDKIELVTRAWMKSYNLEESEIDYLYYKFMILLEKSIVEGEVSTDHRSQIWNIMQLYLALYSKEISTQTLEDSLDYGLVSFFNEYVIFDENGTAGIAMKLNDTLFVNSGLHVALVPGTAGIMFNKSGRGNAGWDTRACVVDEDYTGLVHESMAYTKDCEMSNKIYCGDKLVQMVIIPVKHMDPEEVDFETYQKLMKNSNRGANGFGSGDEKH